MSNSNIRELKSASHQDDWPDEKQEWLESLQAFHQAHGTPRVLELLRALQNQALSSGVPLEEATLNTPYRNTVPVQRQAAYPGNIDIERRIETSTAGMPWRWCCRPTTQAPAWVATSRPMLRRQP